MNHFRCLMLVTLFSAILPTIAWGELPRVMVELAFVLRDRPSADQTPLKEEFEQLLKETELAKEGLIPFLDDWLRGKDRHLHEIDLMQLKIPLGEEVEVATRHSLTTEFQDPKAMFEAANTPVFAGMGLLDDGLSAVVRTEQKPDGKIHVKFRLEKRMPAVLGKSDEGDVSDDPPVPMLRRRWIDSQLDLHPRQAAQLGGLLQTQRKNGKEVTQELAILVRVHLADPAPFPVD